MDDGVRQRAPHRRAARPHHPPCPYPGDERRELPAQAEPVTTPATVRITPRLAPWAHRPLPRAGRRQPRGGRVAPRAGPSHGLRGQAPTQPAVHFYAAAPVHFYAAVDTSSADNFAKSPGAPASTRCTKANSVWNFLSSSHAEDCHAPGFASATFARCTRMNSASAFASRRSRRASNELPAAVFPAARHPFNVRAPISHNAAAYLSGRPSPMAADKRSIISAVNLRLLGIARPFHPSSLYDIAPIYPEKQSPCERQGNTPFSCAE